MKLSYGSVDIIKGYTKATVIALVVLTCSELDIDCESDWAKLEPFFPFLDRAWLLSAHALRLQAHDDSLYLGPRV